jgi:membrane associated rhomboid family serine protease
MDSAPARSGGLTLRQRLAEAPVSYWLAAGNVVVFALLAWHGAAGDAGALVEAGALERGRVASGEVWRLLSAAFLHGNAVHLALNVSAAILAGRLVEPALGPRRYLALYLASAVGGSAASLLGHDAVAVGASGALFGVIGAILVLHRRGLGSWRAFFRSAATRYLVGVLAAFAVVSLAFRDSVPVDDLAHTGGLVTGGAAAWLFTRPAPRRRWPWAVYVAALATAAAATTLPRRGLSSFQALELDQAVHGALAREDVDGARRLLGEAEARGHASARIDYFRALVAAREGRLEVSLETLRRLGEEASAPLREEARRAAARVAGMLAYAHHSGDGRERDARRALEYLDESCRLGEPESCRNAAVIRGGPGAP